MGTVYTSVPTGAAPTIPALAATPACTGKVFPGPTNMTQAITPEVDWVTGTTVTVRPTRTTTYTLEAQGPYGSATRTVQVVVTP